MSVSFCGLALAHPVINGSGTFDAIAARAVFGDALDREFPFAAYVSKTITLEARVGNPPPRLWEAPSGLINSIGLPNKGLEAYIEEDLPRLNLAVPLITNVMGSSAQEFSLLLQACEEQPQIAAVELNVSCPNVRTGLDIGADPRQLEQLLRAVRASTRKPLIVKLTPNTADVGVCAQAAQAGGAEAVSLINTLRAMALAPSGRRLPPPLLNGGPAANVAAAPARSPGPWLGGATGGLSGPAVRSVALAQVAAVAARVSIPVVGMGGVQCAADAQDLLDVGATLVAVGTASFCDPAAGAAVARGLRFSTTE
ncbi:MAG: dihydroorotate dehydrogenase [Actinomycetota bacterium]|nr:dihydroorotate dehydrogenase [Actinomycetota bacterium]